MRILAGDIGGTNTRLSIWERDDVDDAAPPLELAPALKFKNAGVPSLDAILVEYLARTSDALDGHLTDACFGVAGPVDGRRVRLTNIAHWPEVNADDVARRLGIREPHRVNLINDMPAHAASLAGIERHVPQCVTPINPGKPRPTGAQAIVMPGTGLGVGTLIWDERGRLHRPLPTEGGHEDLPARDAETRALIDALRPLCPGGNVTREHVLSGPGLRMIYACLKDPNAPRPDAAPRAEDFLKLETTDPTARRTLDLFARLLGELCGNVALGSLAIGGLYLAGSIANSLRARLASPTFVDAFRASGPPSMRDLIADVPVKLISYEETGLLGAATYATWAAERRV